MNGLLFEIVFKLTIIVGLLNSSQAVTNSNGVSIEVIPKTNLLTGVNYQITFPCRPFAIFTWAEVDGLDRSMRFTQVDDHEERVEFYMKGGKW